MEDYYQNMLRMLQECFRIAAPNSWIIVWYSIRWHHAETAKAITDAGFRLNALPCFWDHKYGKTQQPSLNLPSCYDSFFYAWKGLPSLHKPGRSNVFECKPVVASQKVHTIERPIQLMEDILITFISSGSSIVVPFAGSGNTLLAAGNLHITGVGFDNVQNHCNEYKRKVQEGIPSCYSSILVGSETDMALKGIFK
jgi:DNA modification methylase